MATKKTAPTINGDRVLGMIAFYQRELEAAKRRLESYERHEGISETLLYHVRKEIMTIETELGWLGA